MIRILIVDDDQAYAKLLQDMINSQADMKVSGVAVNGEKALQLASAERPDVVLMDIQMPVMDGITCSEQIKQLHPNTIVILLTNYDDYSFILGGMARKIDGYLLKGSDSKFITSSIRSSTFGKFVMPTEVASHLSESIQQLYKQNDLPFQHEQIIEQLKKEKIALTPQEEKIIKCMLLRLNNQEIAQELFISLGTVKNYMSEIYRKLDVKNRREALKFLSKLTDKK